MQTSSQNNKRIAKNTLMLYVRMLITMGVSLYTSRVVLAALGVEDYGIYSVVGGVVAMFTIVSSSLSGAISRFITFELGKGNQERLNTIFSTSVVIQLIISVVVVLLVESVGMWFLENKMVIPVDRLPAAKWVLHFSAATLVIGLISVPYNATIIAHERMSAFAYISILEVGCKLAVAYFITMSPIDRLVFYAIMLTTVALLVRITYGIYCGRHFEECRRFSPRIDREIFKEMLSFAGWGFFENSSAILRDQGGNILLNLFGGPVVNAARGISLQVKMAVMQFSTNFMTALKPQITKSYARGDWEYMRMLIFQGSRLSYYMLLTLSLPILLNTQYILELWLVNVPAHTVLFVQLSLVFGLLQAFQPPLIDAISATGNIRNAKLMVGFTHMLNLPISYFLLKSGFSPEIIVVVAIVMLGFATLARIYLLRGMIGLSARRYASAVAMNALAVTFSASVVPFLVAQRLETSFGSFVVVSLIAVACTALSIYFVGCNQKERMFVVEKLRHATRKIIQ